MKKKILFTIFKLWKSDIWKIGLRDTLIKNKKKFQFIFYMHIWIYANLKIYFWHKYKTTNKTKEKRT